MRKMKSANLLVLILTVLLATPALAAKPFQPALKKLPAATLVCSYRGLGSSRVPAGLKLKMPAGVIISPVSPGIESIKNRAALSRRPLPDVRLTARNSLAALSFQTPSAITPYLGAGLGYQLGFSPQKLSPADRFLAARDRVFSYRLGAGFGCSLAPSTSLALDYRYSTSTVPEHGSPDTVGGKEGHDISLGLKVAF